MNIRPFWMALLTLFSAFCPIQAREYIEIGGVSVRADSPLAKGEYPRLMITRTQLPAIRARLKHPEIQTYLAQAQDIVRLGKANNH